MGSNDVMKQLLGSNCQGKHRDQKGRNNIPNGSSLLQFLTLGCKLHFSCLIITFNGNLAILHLEAEMA
jgi:hypothetical protein